VINLNIDEKIKLIKEVGEEITTEEELKELFLKKEHPIAYDGFEPSGKIHIAQGLLRTINVNKITKTGIKFKMWVADWFALMNNKMDGDLEKIKITGEYFIEVWKACGMDLNNVEFLWASKHMNQDYWLRTIKIAKINSITRITRCAQIMGRSEKDALSAAQIFYPCMQCSDIFHLNADITQLGMDQRKVNVLAREVAPKLGYKKPIIVSHHMLMGLSQPKTEEGMSGADAAIAKKMSKSNPNSAIFMTDSETQIRKKFNKAYCPEGVAKDNPVLEYCKYIIFEKFDNFHVERYEQEAMDFSSYEELEKAFIEKELHPADLKQSAAKYINELIEPVRKHFQNNKKAKELLEKVESFEITK
jgi:tyrosyl-tRNA synthetase